MTIPANTVSARNVASFVAIAVLAALVVFTGLPNSTKFLQVLHKTGHPLAFGLIALLVFSLLAKRDFMRARPPWVAYLAAFITTVLIGAATEIAQLFTHRDARLADVLSDAVGATACLAGHAAALSSARLARPTGSRLGATLLALAAAGYSLAPLAWCVAAYAVRDAAFPVILENPSRLDMYFVATAADNPSVVPLPESARPYAVPAGAAGGNIITAVRVALDKGEYPGLSITEPYPRWSRYQSLAMDLTNPGPRDLRIVIRVHDRQHNNQYDDRFNRDVILAANSRNTILIPLHDIRHGAKRRLLNLDAIANLNCFAPGSVPDGEFVVNRIWLS